MTGFKQQSGLGTEWERKYPFGETVDKLFIARVVQVNYRYGTVDLVMPKTSEMRMSQGYHVTQGEFSARLPMEYGGLNQYGKPYGTIKPILVGSLVLVGFIDGNRQNPMVLGTYGTAYASDMLKRTDIGSGDPRDKELDVHYSNQLSLHPSLTFSSIGGRGDKVVTFTGKTFFIADSNPKMSNPVTDDGSGLEYEDLKETKYSNGETIEPVTGIAPKMLFKHQGYMTSDGKETDHKLIFFIDEDGTFRVSSMRDKEDWRTYLEIGPNGSFKVRKQKDTKEINRTSNYSEIGIDPDGTPVMRNQDMDLEVRPDGVYSQGELIGSGDGGNGNGDLEDIKKEIDDIKTGMGDLSQSITIVEGKIESKVSFDEIEGLFDDNMVEIVKLINESKENAEKDLAIINEITKDNLLTQEDKELLSPIWENIKAEYPKLVAIGIENDVSVLKYTTAYETLYAYLEPLMADLTLAEDIDGAFLRRSFNTYYKERTDLLEAVLTELKSIALRALEEAKKASKDLTLALSDIGRSQLELAEITNLLDGTRATGTAMPRDKKEIARFLERIEIEYPKILKQAEEHEVPLEGYDKAHDELRDYLVSNELVTNLDKMSPIDTDETLSKFEAYYEEKGKIQDRIYGASLDKLLQHDKDFISVNTSIVQTQREIELTAQRVEKTEGRLTDAEASIQVNADEIAQKVSEYQVGGMIDSNANRDRYSGENIMSLIDSSSGSLDTTTGGITPGKNDAIVSGFMNIAPSVKYTASVTGNKNINKLVVCVYDANKRIVKSYSQDGAGDIKITMELPAEARFLRMTYEYSKTTKGKLERGTVASPWRPSKVDMFNNLELAQEEESRAIKEAEQVKKDSITYKTASVSSMVTISEMAQDNRLEPTEKVRLAVMWGSIEDEYEEHESKATYYGTSSSAYKIAYETLKAYVKPLLKDMTVASSINGDTFKRNFETYYGERDKLWDVFVIVADERVASVTAMVKEIDVILSNVEMPGEQLMNNTTFRGGFFKVVGAKWEIDNNERFRSNPVAKLTYLSKNPELYMEPIDAVDGELKGKEVTFSTYLKANTEAPPVVTLQGYEKLEDIGTKSTVEINRLRVEKEEKDYTKEYVRFSNVGLVPLTFEDPVTKAKRNLRYITIKVTLDDSTINEYTAYANSPDGSKDFTTYYPNENLYSFKEFAYYYGDYVVKSDKYLTMGIRGWANQFMNNAQVATLFKPNRKYRVRYRYTVTEADRDRLTPYKNQNAHGTLLLYADNKKPSIALFNNSKVNTIEELSKAKVGDSFIREAEFVAPEYIADKDLNFRVLFYSCRGMDINNPTTFVKIEGGEISDISITDVTDTPYMSQVYLPSPKDDSTRYPMKYVGTQLTSKQNQSQVSTDYTWDIVGEQPRGILTSPNGTLWVAMPMVTEGTTLAGWSLSAEDYQRGLDTKESAIIKQDNEPVDPEVDLIWIDTSRTDSKVITYGELINKANVGVGQLDLETGRVVPDPEGVYAYSGRVNMVDRRLKITSSGEDFEDVEVATYNASGEFLGGWPVSAIGNYFFVEDVPDNTEYIVFSATAKEGESKKLPNASGWSAMATSEGQTIQGKTTDVTKRWTGTEWVVINPSDIKDIGGMPKGEGDEIIARLQEAEQRITKTAITSTVTESQDFRDLLGGKADVDDLNGLATEEQLKAEREQYLKELDSKMDEIDIKFTSYVSNSELVQTKEEFNFYFKKAGGVNLIRNSIGFNGTNYFFNYMEDDVDKEPEGPTKPSVDEDLEPLPGAFNVARNPCFMSGYGPLAFYDWADIGGTAYPEAFRTATIFDHPKLYSTAVKMKTNATRVPLSLTQSRIPTIPGQEYVVHFWVKVGFAMVNSKLAIRTARTSYDTGDTSRYDLTKWENKGWVQATHRFIAYGEHTTLTVGKVDVDEMTYEVDVTGVQVINRSDMLGASDAITTPVLKNDMEGVQGLPDVEALGYSSAFRVKGTVVKYQRILLPRDEQFSLSFMMNSYNNSGVTVSLVNDKDKPYFTLGGASTNNQYRPFSTTFSTPKEDKVYLKISSTSTGEAVITGLMLNVGLLQLNWTAYPSEVYNTNVRIDMGGIKVINSDNSGYTVITPREFSGYTRINNRVRRVFTLNGDTTEVKKLKVESSITMTPFVLSSVSSGSYSGWALLTDD